jgi:hypothetical protein
VHEKEQPYLNQYAVFKGDSMKFSRYLSALFVISSVGSLFASISMDPLWIYKDLPDTEKIFNNFQIFDTCRTTSVLPLYETSTGEKYDSNYINFDYKFSADTMKVFDPFDPDTVTYSDYRPGYAGFKIDWDGGVTGFPLAKYRYIILAHKGPLPNHKVTIRFGYNKECGSPTKFQTIGSFAASATWKVDTVFIPDSVRNVSAEEISTRSYYEMQFLINNASSTDTNKSSAQGNFKVDNIGLVDKGTGVINRSAAPARTASKSFFIPSATGPVQISAYSLSGEQLYDATINVVAGQKYSISSFIAKNVPLLPSSMKCIKIRGAGIDLLQKVR